MPSTALRVSYVGMSNYRLPVTIDLNQIAASTIPWDTGRPAGTFVDSRAPYQNWTLLMSSENLGHSSYNAGVIEIGQKLRNGLAFNANYTLAKNLSDAQGSDAPTVFAGEEAYAVEIANRFDVRSNRGNVVATPRNRALISGTYQLPFGSGRTWKGSHVMDAIFGDWDLSTVATNADRAVADTDHESGVRSVKHGYGGSLRRWRDSAAGLRWRESLSERNSGSVLQCECLY